MKIISFTNQKGGVAKTTSCLNVGAALAIEGKKVLLIDLDPQGSLTKCVGICNLDQQDVTTYEVLKGNASITKAIRCISRTACYDIIPVDIRMSGAEIELISIPGRDYLLKEALTELKSCYDYVLIDCNPSLNILTLMALTASDSVIIPVATQYMPLDGVAQLLRTIELVQKRLNKGLKIGGVIVTMYDSRRSMDKQIIESIQARFPNETYKAIVKSNSKLAEAPTFGQDIFEYDARSAGAKAYKAIAVELLEREV